MVCSCIQECDRCVVCKDYEHDEMNCIERLKMHFMEDNYCIRYICDCRNWVNLNAENFFFECSNCGYFCVVCGRNWNDFGHRVCVFMMKYFYIFKEVYKKVKM